MPRFQLGLVAVTAAVLAAAPAALAQSSSDAAPPIEALQPHSLGVLSPFDFSPPEQGMPASVSAPPAAPTAATTAAAATGIVPAEAPADDATIKPQEVNGIVYVTGGVGDEEHDVMKSLEKDFNVRVSITSKDGSYLGDAHVVLTGAKGKELLNIDIDPLLYVKLPAGTYWLQATTDAGTQKKKIVVTGKKPISVHLVW